MVFPSRLPCSPAFSFLVPSARRQPRTPATTTMADDDELLVHENEHDPFVGQPGENGGEPGKPPQASKQISLMHAWIGSQDNLTPHF